MTIKELIEQLENYDQDLEVKIVEVIVEEGGFYDQYLIENIFDIDHIAKTKDGEFVCIAMEKQYEG